VNVLLISTYELGRQPFGLASPAAWLREAGFDVRCLDLDKQPLNQPGAEAAVRAADAIAFFLPMHTATRIALRVLPRVRALNAKARLAGYGLYAPMNEPALHAAGLETLIGGEFETELVAWAQRTASAGNGSVQGPDQSPEKSIVSLDRLTFRVPDRAGLPPLQHYAKLKLPDGSERVAGYTEASRGCKHLCRHCPVVPVYNGHFRVVQRAVVLEDVRRQVAAGAQHITFGDADFFNGPAHAMEIVRALHREFPALSYDVTIKVEHLLQHAALLADLRATGCAFVTTAVESFDDHVLELLEKGHTRADFERVVGLARDAALPLAPTFIPFTPWTTLSSYTEFLSALADLGLRENVSPVQLAIRLLIPSGSRLLELQEVRELVGPFDAAALLYPWLNPDARVDALQREVEAMIAQRMQNGASRGDVFAAVWQRTQRVCEPKGPALRELPPLVARAAIPYLTEPWYC